MANQNPLNIVSLNANGLGDIKKRRKLIVWLKKFHDVDNKIIFLQETHTTEKLETRWKNEWNNRNIYFSHGTSGSKGVAIIFPKILNYKVNKSYEDANGRYVALNITIDQNTFCLLNCYAPCTNQSKNQLEWLSEIQNILEENSDTNIIIGGDLNDCFIPSLDKFRCKPNTDETEYVKAWKVICSELNLADCWRLLNPNKRCYTWRQGSSLARLKQSRLDYWIVSMNMMYNLDEVDIKSSIGSDHSLIDINFYKSNTPQRGPSFWNFNASLLKEPQYVNQINTCYTQATEKYKNVNDHSLKWDLIKMEMRSTTICYSKTKARKTRELINNTMISINKLEQELNNQASDEILNKYNEEKKIIEDYNNEKANGALLRSKTDWAEYGEKNTKFFLNLEKRNYKLKCITKLIDENEKEITSQEDILKYEEKFYNTLYTLKELPEKQKQEAANMFNDESLPKLSNENKQTCETDLSLKEIGEALKDLKNGKSPGSDGFTSDFYKFFWPLIKNTVFESLLYSYNNGKLSIDQRRGIINLIPKKDKDPRFLKNWRPISLLNTDYKIITKTLANRIKKVLPTVINPDQVAYLKDRFIGQNIRTILDIMGYTRIADKNGIIAFLDFEKAFDTIKWNVIYDALNNFNVGQNFIKWVKIIYNESEACVTNNGFSSPFFKLQRGVRQGCPLSAYLFIMVVELLAHKIRINKEIKGIKIGQTEIKLVQMADDTTAFVEDEKSLENIFNILEKFEMYAGLKLNKTKTEAMWLGKDKNNVHEPLNIKWVKQVHSLGIFFSYDSDSVVMKNFMDRAKEFKKILDLWSMRDLSLIGKITILKSLALSKIIYQCAVLTAPPNFVESVNDIAYQFLWSKKPAKVKKETIIANYKHGGLKMIDITSFIKAQKVTWVKRLLSSDDASWKALPKLFFNELLGLDTFKCNMKCETKPKNFPGFYWQILKCWNEVKNVINTNKTKTPPEIRRETLWLNKNITINEREMLDKNWHNKGINIIHDIINKDGKFLTAGEIEQKYEIPCDVLKYNALKEAIPVEWRQILKTMKIDQEAISFQEQPHLTINNISKPLQLLKNRDFYWALIEHCKQRPIIIDKIIKDLKINETNEDSWGKVFMVSKSVRDTKLQSFQYKILYNLTPCNLYLNKIGKSDTRNCETCNEMDDIPHYFFECKQVEPFWNSFQIWWKNMTEEQIILDSNTVKIGITDNLNSNEALNACILIAKWHIYKNKLNGSPIFFYKYLCDLKYHLVIEKNIALKYNKLAQHNKKWQIIEDYVT